MATVLYDLGQIPCGNHFAHPTDPPPAVAIIHEPGWLSSEWPPRCAGCIAAPAIAGNPRILLVNLCPDPHAHLDVA